MSKNSSRTDSQSHLSNSGHDYSLQEEEMDVPDAIEEIIELLLTGLKDTVCL